MSQQQRPGSDDTFRQDVQSVEPTCFVAAYDADQALVYASERFRSLPPSAATAMLDTLVQRALALGEVGSIELALPDAQGGPRLHRVEVSPDRGADGRIAGALVVGRDAGAPAPPPTSLEDGERAFRSLAENAGDTILRWSPQAVTLYVNPALDRLYGGRGHALIGRRPSEAARRNLEPMRALEACVLQVAATARQELFALHMQDPGSGERLVHQLRIVPELDAGGRVVSVLGIGRDVTGTVTQLEQIERLLHVDALTLLPSRRALEERGASLLDAAGSRSAHVGLLRVDLDRFRFIEDTLGHDAGDLLLRTTAARLQSCAGHQDLLVRLDGCSFALLVPGARSRDGLLKLAGQVHEAIGRPLQLAGREWRVTASIGLVWFPDDASGLDDLLRCAEAALQQARRAGPGRTGGPVTAVAPRDPPTG